MTYIRLIIELIILFFISKITFVFLIKNSFQNKWVDKPNDPRKIHNKIIPNTAGLIFMPFVLVSILPTIKFFGASNVQILSVGFSYLFFVLMGWIDDRRILNFRVRLLLQISIVIINLTVTGWGMPQFLKEFYIYGILPEPFTYIFLSLFLVGAMNAINWWDGVNGNLGFWILNFSIVLFFILPPELLDAWNFLFIITIIFLKFNYPIAKIFMGDVGSMPIGFILSYLTLQALQFKNFNAVLSFDFNPYMMLTLVWTLPFFDMIRLVVFRYANKVSPALADKNHFHHYFHNIFKNKGIFIPIILYVIINLTGFILIDNIWIGIILSLSLYLTAFWVINLIGHRLEPITSFPKN